MCGILGIAAAENSQVSLSQDQLIAMRDRMVARGPDDATLLCRENVAFAHRRLAIRDRTYGQQPSVSENGRYLLTYNGEIYNDKQLRSELKALGHRFRGHGDTEVLTAAWQQWQADAVPKLRGMFAFGVYDFLEKKLTLVRDRFGIKPLFYTLLDEEVIFASTLAALTEHPRFTASPNFVAIRHYLLTLRLTLGDQTVFENLLSVRPAEMISFQQGQKNSQIYWTPPTPDDTSSDQTFEEAVDRLEKTMREAVAIRMASDVPVGMMLSGGVDSSTLACLMKEGSGGGFHARCGGGVDEQFTHDVGDFAFARDCAQHNDLEFQEVGIGPEEYLQRWQFLVEQYETPVSTPTDVIIHKIARNLRQSVGVALGGEGADEACCGYQIPHWSGADYDLLGSLDHLHENRAGVARESLSRQYGNATFQSAGDLYLACNGLISREAQQVLFRDEVWQHADADFGVEDHYHRQFNDLAGMPTVEKTAHVLLNSNLESLLSRLDSATMQAGLESRVPFTDHLFVEQVFRLPHSFRIDISPNETSPWRSSLDLANRGSLRPKRMIHALAQRLMPSHLAQRPKSSFSTPVPSWLDKQWKPWLRSRIQNSEFANLIFRPSALNELTSLPSQLSMWNWPMANVILWGDRWFR